MSGDGVDVEGICASEGTTASEETTGEDAAAKDEPTPLVLEPDHPMMERFQRALKTHLERIKHRITEEVSELDNDMRMREKEKETVGVELYALQQELFRQQTTLEKCAETIESLIMERESANESMQAKRIKWKEEVDRLNVAKKKEHEMSTELHKLSSLEKQIEKWETDMDSSLAVAQRISEKTQADRSKIIEEKRKMDMYMLRLMTEVTKFEAEIKFTDAELQIKWEEKHILHQTLTDANADLQALIDEQKRLFGAWKSVVATMSQRDTVYMAVHKELLECQEAFKTLNSEIDSYKRSAADAMRKNEQLSVIYGRILSEKESVEASLKSTAERKREIEDRIALLAATIGQTEKELAFNKLELNQLEAQYAARMNEFNKISIERQAAEDKTLTLLHNQMTNNKTAMHLNKIVKELKAKSREKEFSLVEAENKISKRYLEVEDLRGTISRNNEIIAVMNKELDEKEQELKLLENELNKCHMAIVQKQGSIAVLLKKVEKQMEKMGTLKHGQDPLHLRITELEKANADLQEKNDKMQSLWLLQQNNNIKLTNQRYEQVKEMSLLRKQVTVLEQKTLKTELEIETEEKTFAEVKKSIGALQNKMVVLNQRLIGKKDYSSTLDRENGLMQSHFLHALKESELEQVKLKSEISQLEGSIEELAEGLLQTQWEIVAWERKIKMAIETKENIIKERSGSGEIAQMKSEIHRMEIRYDQLRKAQEKMVGDLELCVLRRDAILDVADAREKRQAQGASTRYMLQKKIDNIKSKIKSLQNERCNILKTIKFTKAGQEDLRDHINRKEEKFKEMDEKTRKLDRELEDRKLCKQQNLEMLIRRQKKCKMYNQVKAGKHRLLHKSEDTIDCSLQRERSINADLVTVSEALLADFPCHRFHIARILNTASLKPS